MRLYCRHFAVPHQQQRNRRQPNGLLGVAASFGLVAVLDSVSAGSNAPVITFAPVAAAVGFSVAVGLAGTQAFGPGILAGIGVAPGETWLFQVAYRTLTPSCGTGINWSNAVRLTFTN